MTALKKKLEWYRKTTISTINIKLRWERIIDKILKTKIKDGDIKSLSQYKAIIQSTRNRNDLPL